MKQNSPIISIPDPCHENWDAMTPAQQGRHCGACQKTVIDFTLMTDGQILDVIKKANGRHPCGRYLTSQLNRKLIDTRPKTTFINLLAKRMAAMLLLVQSATTAMAQQAKSHIVTVEQYEEDSRDARGRIQVAGKLINTKDNQPLPHMSVHIKQTDTTIFSDTAGFFSFSLPAEVDSVTLLMNHTPYSDGGFAVALSPFLPILEQTIAINKTKNGGEITVSVSYDPIALALPNPPVAMGVWPGPQEVRVDWLRNCKFVAYTIFERKTATKRPTIKERLTAHSGKSVWGRLTNYWTGKE